MILEKQNSYIYRLLEWRLIALKLFIT